MRMKMFALACSVLFLATSPNPSLTEDPQIQAMYAAAMRHRSQYGLGTQILDESLCQTAQNWANNMAARNMMYHGGGEQVIGRGYANAEACVQGWVYSPGHRVWVLGGTSRCGFGCARSASGQLFFAGVYR